MGVEPPQCLHLLYTPWANSLNTGRNSIARSWSKDRTSARVHAASVVLGLLGLLWQCSHCALEETLGLVMPSQGMIVYRVCRRGEILGYTSDFRTGLMKCTCHTRTNTLAEINWDENLAVLLRNVAVTLPSMTWFRWPQEHCCSRYVLFTNLPAMLPRPILPILGLGTANRFMFRPKILESSHVVPAVA